MRAVSEHPDPDPIEPLPGTAFSGSLLDGTNFATANQSAYQFNSRQKADFEKKSLGLQLAVLQSGSMNRKQSIPRLER